MAMRKKKLLVFFSLFFFLFLISIPSIFAWWDTNWLNYVNISIVNPDSYAKNDATIKLIVNISNSNIANCKNEIRVINDSNVELSSYVMYNISYDSYIGCAVIFEDNIPTVGKNVSIYYNYASATYPSYGSLPVLTEWNKTAYDDFEDGDDEGWSTTGGGFDVQEAWLNTTSGNWVYNLTETSTAHPQTLMDLNYTDFILEARYKAVVDYGGAGIWIFLWYWNDSQHYYGISNDPANPTVAYWSDYAWGDYAQYVSASNKYTWITYTIKVSGKSIKLYEDGTSVEEGTTTAVYKTGKIGMEARDECQFYDNITVYNIYSTYDGNVTITNLTEQSKPVAKDVLMNLYLNGTQANSTFIVGSHANFTALTNITGLPIKLTCNYDGFIEQSGYTSILNYTYLRTFDNNFNLTTYWEGNATYDTSNVTYWFNITLIPAVAVVGVDYGIIINFIKPQYLNIEVR